MAQLVLGNISGTVTDAQNAVAAGAKVVSKNNDMNLTVSATAQSDGRYHVDNLPIGKCSAMVTQAGFGTQLFSEIVVQADRTVTLDTQLKVGQIATTIEVTGTPLRNDVDTTMGYAIGQGLATPAPETIEEMRVNTAGYDTAQGANVAASDVLTAPKPAE